MAKGFWNALTGGTSQGFNQAFGRGWEAEEAREYQRLVQDDIRNIANAQRMYESITPEESNIQQPALEQNIQVPKVGDVKLSNPFQPNAKGMQLSTAMPAQGQTETKQADIPSEQERNIQVPTMANQMQKWGYRDLSQQAEPTQSLLAGMKPLEAGEEIVRQADRRVGKTLSGLLEGMASMKTEKGRQLYQQWLMTEKKTPEQLTDGDRALIPLLSEAYSRGDNTAYSTYYPLLSSFGQAHWDKLKSGLVRDDKPKDFGIGTMITVEQARQIAKEQGILFEVPKGTTHVNLEYEDNSKRVKSLKPVAVSSGGGGGGGGKPKEGNIYLTQNTEERIKTFKYMKDYKSFVQRKAGEGGNAFSFKGVGDYDKYEDLVESPYVQNISKNSGVPASLLADKILKDNITGGNYVIRYDNRGGIDLIPKEQYDNFGSIMNKQIEEVKQLYVREATASGKATKDDALKYLEARTKTGVNPAQIIEWLKEDYKDKAITDTELSLLIEILYYETGFLPETAKIVSSNIKTEG